MNSDLIITPKTKVDQLLETYPHLEDVLTDYLPEFKKLKDPALRKTVAKITTLQQAAAIGNVKVEDLINKLRDVVGQDLYTGTGETKYNTSQPEWFKENLITTEFDVREMLAQGEHPVNQVIADLNTMETGKIYKLIAPFLPAPLIDKAGSLHIPHWIDQKSEEMFHIYFYKP
ncbi:DUF1858 domain-containing protein [Prosthecochloris sp. SCSIO W1101]|uniref:DUF1858 domain-containing protein n=1 Tax=Prosthecochloris sp. SCSIO W1101 TaxID=2992242 RepID=UPI00223C8E2F|nr:DUF1858 domain-containing protein [Prosthecochloris sp. SCSIO W1101]UZJ42702.1 DUF1858 domain-containing protein [Prosthecochloris sp. SCSIO W1101]